MINEFNPDKYMAAHWLCTVLVILKAVSISNLHRFESVDSRCMLFFDKRSN